MAVAVGNPSRPQPRTRQVSEIKTDRSLLAAVPRNEQTRVMVRALIVLSRSLGRLLTAGTVQWRNVDNPPVGGVRPQGRDVSDCACILGRGSPGIHGFLVRNVRCQWAGA